MGLLITNICSEKSTARRKSKFTLELTNEHLEIPCYLVCQVIKRRKITVMFLSQKCTILLKLAGYIIVFTCLLLTCPYFGGGDFCILIAQNRRNYGITGELSAFVPSLKSFRGGWWVVCISGMDLKSQCVTCFHAWKQPAWFATSQPQESLPAASSPQLPGLSQQHGIHPNKASRRLFGWQTMKDELILLPTLEEVLPRWKGKKMPSKEGKRQRAILERQV